MNVIWIAFLTGLTTGGISCLAVQGGLLTSSIATVQGSDAEKKGKWAYVSAFLLAKLVAYVMLGYLLGAIGSTFLLSPKTMGSLQILAGVFMIWASLRLLDIHPIFRYGIIQSPRWTYRLLKNQTHNASFLGPAIMGFLTVLMPCGITQATMAVAIASGSPLMGALIMGAFVLGTSPIFFALGASVSELLKRPAFSFVAALVVGVFAVLSINGGLALRGSFYTAQNLWAVARMTPEQLAGVGGVLATVDAQGKQQVAIQVYSQGYKSSATTLKVGVPVQLSLVTNNTQGCTRAFTIPDMNVNKTLEATGTEVVEFTPTKTGRLAYACGMGMYTGAFTVIN
jgi:sulfite exporter TauE/SafE